MCLIGNTELLCMQCRVIGPQLTVKGKSYGLSRVAAGTWGIFSSYSRGCTFKTRVCSVKSGLLYSYDRHLRNLNYAWQDNTDASGGEAGDQASLSSLHIDIGIPINFQEELGFVTF